MPDGDRLHPGLGLSYQLPYRRLCEGVIRPDEQARGIAARIKRDIARGQCDFVPALQAVMTRLDVLSDSASRNGWDAIDWQHEGLGLRKAVINAHQGLGTVAFGSPPRGVSKRNCEVVLRAAQDLLNEVEEGSVPTNAREALCQRFTKHLYKSQFGDAAPILEEHFDHVEKAVVRERLQGLESHVTTQLTHLAEQLARHQDDSPLHLRLAPRKREKIHNLDADIMDIFN